MMPVRIGENIEPPVKVKDAKPVYPPEARAAGVSGVVLIEAVIDVNGNIRDARVLRSIPGLDEAALDAVRQWQYKPAIVEGTVRPVIMTLTINFSLQLRRSLDAVTRDPSPGSRL